MTDEEIGRKWCAANGKAPLKTRDGWMWSGPEDGPIPQVYYQSETEAYSDLGVALRDLMFTSRVRPARPGECS